MEERVFKVGPNGVGKYKKCLVCEKEFKEGEEFILCPIQKPKSGWASVMSIPIHEKCYWVED